MSGKYRRNKHSVKSNDDRLLTGEEKQRKRWKVYFELLLGGEFEEEHEGNLHEVEELQGVIVNHPIKAEIKAAIKNETRKSFRN